MIGTYQNFNTKHRVVKEVVKGFELSYHHAFTISYKSVSTRLGRCFRLQVKLEFINYRSVYKVTNYCKGFTSSQRRNK